MDYLISVTVVALLGYLAFKVHVLGKTQITKAAFLEAQTDELQNMGRRSEIALPYGWFDDGWPAVANRPDAPNPDLSNTGDEYTQQMAIAQYLSMSNPRDRVEFVRELKRSRVWMKSDLYSVIFSDENTFVRAWAAGHLDLTQCEIPSDESSLRSDGAQIVRAALWSNPSFGHLPWHGGYGVGVGGAVRNEWGGDFRQMSRLERLGLMRNPELSPDYVLALLEAQSDDLDISPTEHGETLRAAAYNPVVIADSRQRGRQGYGNMLDWFELKEVYGKIWDSCLNKWLTHEAQASVCYAFFRYVQTSPTKKLEIYQRLRASRGKDTWMERSAIIDSCDRRLDKETLKSALSDPNEGCREMAKELLAGKT